MNDPVIMKEYTAAEMKAEWFRDGDRWEYSEMFSEWIPLPGADISDVEHDEKWRLVSREETPAEPSQNQPTEDSHPIVGREYSSAEMRPEWLSVGDTWEWAPPCGSVWEPHKITDWTLNHYPVCYGETWRLVRVNTAPELETAPEPDRSDLTQYHINRDSALKALEDALLKTAPQLVWKRHRPGDYYATYNNLDLVCEGRTATRSFNSVNLDRWTQFSDDFREKMCLAAETAWLRQMARFEG